MAIKPGVLEKHGIRIKRKPDPVTEEEMAEAKAKPRLPPVSEQRARKPINVTLDPLAVVIARSAGHGVISRGIDRALFHFEDCAVARKPKRKSGPRKGSRDVRKMR